MELADGLTVASYCDCATTDGLDRIHSCNADAARNVFVLIFHGIVAQYTVALLVMLSRHMRSSASAVAFLNHITVPSSDSSTATNPPSRAVT
jgi:hypothetical protein